MARMKDSDAYQAGFAEGQDDSDGASYLENPYEYGTREHAYWQRGLTDGSKE